MSIFGRIASKIFGSRQAQANPAAPGSSAAPSSQQQAGVQSPQRQTSQQQSSSQSAQQGSVTMPAMTRSQVEDMIQKIADEKSAKSNWRESIVDLMKLLDLDSSLDARKELAQELGYTGALDGSAEMNIWLHKQVMRRLEESGGRVPDEMKH